MSIGRFWWGNFLKKQLLIIFGHSPVNFRPFVENLSAELSKLHSRCQWKNLDKFISSEKIIILGFWPTNLRSFVVFFCKSVVKTASYVSSGELWGIFFCIIYIHFLYIERKIVGFLSRKLQRDCQNCILRVHRNLSFLKKKLFFRTKFHNFRPWKRKLWLFVEKFTAKSSKPNFTG